MNDCGNLLEEIPEEIRGTLVNVVTSFESIEKLFEEAQKEKLDDKIDSNNPLEKAKVDVTYCYAINALFYVYMRCKGVDPKEHPVMDELNRVMSTVVRCESLDAKRSRMRVDKDASKRFVRNAIWQAAKSKARKRQSQPDSDDDISESEMEQSTTDATTSTSPSKRPRT